MIWILTVNDCYYSDKKEDVMYFHIELERATMTANMQRRLSQNMRSVAERADQIARSGVKIGDANTTASIKAAIRKSASGIYTLAKNSDNCSATLNSVVSLYREADRKAAGRGFIDWKDIEKYMHPNPGYPWYQPPLLWPTPFSTADWHKNMINAWKNFLDKLFNDGGFAGAVLAGTIAFGGTGISLTGELLSGSVKGKKFAEWNAKEGKIGAGAEISAEGQLAKGTVKRETKYHKTEASASVGYGAASGGVGITLFNQGKFAPGVQAEAKGKVSVVHGTYKDQLGTDEFNVHKGAEGDLLVAKAEAEAHAGYYTYKDASTGETKKGFGVGASAGAEAYVAEGKVSGGITVFGVKIDLSISGKAGGAGAKASAKVGTEAVEGEVGLGLGLGLGIKGKIDWTGFKLPWQK